MLYALHLFYFITISLMFDSERTIKLFVKIDGGFVRLHNIIANYSSLFDIMLNVRPY